MSKQKRELLILFAILVVMGGVFYLRSGGGGGPTPNPQLTQLSSGQQAAAGGVQGAGTPVDQLVTFANQFPLDFLLPGLSDSAVVAKILGERISNPFAENHLRPARTVRNDPTRPVRPARPDTVYVELDEWPQGVRYTSVAQKVDEPGVWTVRINNTVLRMGDEIPGTGFVLVEVNPLLVRIRKEETVGNVITITTYRHVIGRLMEAPW